MPSILASQLNALNEKSRNGIVPLKSATSRFKASFLFDGFDAADVDRNAILTIGQSGLVELDGIVPGIRQKYEQPLFSEGMLDCFRDQMTTEQNAELDLVLENFFIDMAPFFLESATAKCLEWLIRQFNVQEFNIAALVQALVPYHETKAFVKLVGLSRFGDQHELYFLNEMRKEQIGLDRETLVRRCITDHRIFLLISDGADKIARQHPNSYSSFWSFITVFMMEYITLEASSSSKEQISESAVRAVLKFVFKMLKEATCAAAQLCGYLVLSHLSLFTQLREDVVATFQTLLAKYATPENRPKAFLTLLQLSQTQSTQTMSKKALLNLLSWKQLPSLLGEAKQRYQCANLLLLISSQSKKVNTAGLEPLKTVLDDTPKEKSPEPAPIVPLENSKKTEKSALLVQLESLNEEVAADLAGKKYTAIAKQLKSEGFKSLFAILELPKSDVSSRTLLVIIGILQKYCELLGSDELSWELAQTLFYKLTKFIKFIDLSSKKDSLLNTAFSQLVTDLAKAAFDSEKLNEKAILFVFKCLLAHNAASSLINEFILHKVPQVFPRYITELLLSNSLPTKAQMVALSLVKEFLQTLIARNLAYDCQMLLPCIMYSCTSSEKQVRTLALELLGCIRSMKAGKTNKGTPSLLIPAPGNTDFPYIAKATFALITNVLLSHDSSIEADANYLQNWLDNEYWQRSPSGSKPLFKFLLAHLQILRSEASKIFILRLVKRAAFPGRLAYTCPEISDTASDAYLNLLLDSFGTEQGFSAVDDTSGALETFLKLIDPRTSSLCKKHQGKLQSLVTPQWLSAMSEKTQTLLLERFAEICVFEQAKSGPFVSLLQTLPYNGYAVSSIIKKYQQALDDDHNNSLDSLYLLLQILDLVCCNSNIVSGQEALIQPLFEVLGFFQSIETDFPLEYAKQLVLQGLTNLIEAGATIDGNVLHMDTIVKVLRSTDTPQTHNQTCLLLIALCRTHPGLVLNNILPLVTLVGTSLVRKEDGYSFSLVQKLLEAVLPTVAEQAKRSVPLRGSPLKQLSPVLQVFVGALSRVPPHRRVNLLIVLTSSLGIDEYLGAFLAMTLYKPVPDLDLDHAVELLNELLEHFSVSVKLSAARFILEQLPGFEDCLEVDDDNDLRTCLFGQGAFSTKTNVMQAHYRTFTFVRAFFGRLDALDGAPSDLCVPILRRLLELCESISLLDGVWNSEKRLKSVAKASVECCKMFALSSLPLLTFFDAVSVIFKAEKKLWSRLVSLLHMRMERTRHRVLVDNGPIVYPILDELCTMLSDRTIVANSTVKQQAILCINTISAALCGAQPQKFMSVLSVIASSTCMDVTQVGTDVASASLITLATLIKALQVKALSHVPKFMPMVLSNSMIELTKKDGVNNKVLKAGLLSVLEVVVEQLSLFLDPYLVQILDIALDESMWNDVSASKSRSAVLLDAQAQEKARKIITLLTSKVEPKLLFNASEQFLLTNFF